MFINLPLRYARLDETLVDTFLSHSICPEIGLDADSLDQLPEQYHHDLAQRLRDAGLKCSVHLPFLELRPAAEDPFIREASRKRLEVGMRIARIYDPAHMVGHPSLQDVYFENSAELQRSNSCQTWGSLLDEWPGHPPLFLENTLETEPDLLVALLSVVQDKGVGVCFDIGHWNSFANGSKRKNLEEWIAAFAPFRMHLHLHDNNGESDQHLGMGQGTIPWDEFEQQLDKYDIHPTATGEPHTRDAFKHSAAFLQGHKLGARIK
ncbi:MAG: sugar phosphate isomerase/epimerase family protein [Desulfovibrio sp.]|uniref:sugar phosphate isomerase/epimerase family protein n=1 Tax=Desulfovibrio sp. 7SRBS1 TaxID=3378064 RepID=UPI003B3F4539